MWSFRWDERNHSRLELEESLWGGAGLPAFLRLPVVMPCLLTHCWAGILTE